MNSLLKQFIAARGSMSLGATRMRVCQQTIHTATVSPSFPLSARFPHRALSPFLAYQARWTGSSTVPISEKPSLAHLPATPPPNPGASLGATIELKTIPPFTPSTSTHKEVKIGSTRAEILQSFSHYSLGRLLLTAFILKACSYKWWISALAPAYISFITRYPILSRPTQSLVRASFFRQFCGGENGKDVATLMSSLASSNIGSILDPAMEEDLAELALPEAQLHQGQALLFHLIHSKSSLHLLDKMKERLELIHSCIDLAAQGTNSANPQFVALKLTCLVPTGILYQLTQLLDSLMARLDPSKTGYTDLAAWNAALDVFKGVKGVHVEELEAFRRAGSIAFAELVSQGPEMQERSPSVLVRALLFSLKPEALMTFYTQVHLPFLSTTLCVPFTPVPRDSLMASLELSLADTRAIIQTAAVKGVSLMIDAEQTYFQTAIHYLTKLLTPSQPAGRPMLYGTYQMYLKDGLHQLYSDFLTAERANLPFGLKLVRGAYMESERARAATLAIPDPICDTIQMTHEHYQKAMDFLLTKSQAYSKSSVFLASHNVGSVEAALTAIQQASNMEGRVMFGQLLGMSDHLTFSVSRLGRPAYKYVPIGSVAEVLPYLIRRAQENSSLLGRAGDERNQIMLSLRHKLKSMIGRHD